MANDLLEERTFEEKLGLVEDLAIASIIIRVLHKRYGPDIMSGLSREESGLPMRSNYYFEQY